MAFLALCFGFVIAFGAPYLPSKKHQIGVALKLLDLPKGSTLLELGAGDGRVALAALKMGYKVVAIELNPVLCVIIFFVTFKYRRSVKIIWGDFWKASWPKSVDGIFTFLLVPYMNKLDAKILALKKPVKLVSFAFEIPGKKYDKIKDYVFLYDYANSAKISS